MLLKQVDKHGEGGGGGGQEEGVALRMEVEDRVQDAEAIQADVVVDGGGEACNNISPKPPTERYNVRCA